MEFIFPKKGRSRKNVRDNLNLRRDFITIVIQIFSRLYRDLVEEKVYFDGISHIF
jgi:hypothetical protein